MITRTNKKGHKIKNTLFILGIFIIFGFSLIGLYFFTTIIHEMIHYQELKNFTFDNEICIVNYEPSWKILTGYHVAYHNVSQSDKVEDIREYGEVRAYFVSIMIVLSYIISVVIVVSEGLFND